MNIPEYVGTPNGSGRLVNLNGDLATVEMWDGRQVEFPIQKLSWSGNASTTAGGPNVVKIRPTNSGMNVDRPTDIKPKKLTDEELAKRQKEFYYQEKEARAKRDAEKAVKEAAEAERMKKGLIGVDFGGRGGKMPKEKAPTFPKDAKFQKNQEVTYDGRPAKVVQYDGNGVYTVKVGNSHQQVHMSELKGGKGKPKKKK